MPDVFELELFATMPNYYAWIMEAFGPLVRGHVVEYGAGTGTISQLLFLWRRHSLSSSHPAIWLPAADQVSGGAQG